MAMTQPELDIPVAKNGKPLNLKESVNMEAIQLLVESNVPYPKIAERFADKGVTCDLLRLWAHRNKWATPAKVEIALANAKAQLIESEKVTGVNLSSETKVKHEDDKLTILAQEAARTGKRSLSGLVHRLAPALDKFTPDVPETIGEAAILLKMLTKAAGLDSQGAGNQTNVQVNVVAGPWGRTSVNESFMDAPDED